MHEQIFRGLRGSRIGNNREPITTVLWLWKLFSQGLTVIVQSTVFSIKQIRDETKCLLRIPMQLFLPFLTVTRQVIQIIQLL